MARETKAQYKARYEADNAAAAKLNEGLTATSNLFGVLTLGPKVSHDEWDMYTVYFDEQIGDKTYPDIAHTWSSAVVVRSFKA